jgi:hypothetical protein
MLGDALKEGLIALARDEAGRPGGRERMAAALRAALAEIESMVAPSAEVRLEGAFVTPGTARALRRIAEGLSLVAEGAGHVADHAQVILRPPGPPERR